MASDTDNNTELSEPESSKGSNVSGSGSGSGSTTRDSSHGIHSPTQSTHSVYSYSNVVPNPSDITALTWKLRVTVLPSLSGWLSDKPSSRGHSREFWQNKQATVNLNLSDF